MLQSEPLKSRSRPIILAHAAASAGAPELRGTCSRVIKRAKNAPRASRLTCARCAVCRGARGRENDHLLFVRCCSLFLSSRALAADSIAVRFFTECHASALLHDSICELRARFVYSSLHFSVEPHALGFVIQFLQKAHSASKNRFLFLARNCGIIVLRYGLCVISESLVSCSMRVA